MSPGGIPTTWERQSAYPKVLRVTRRKATGVKGVDISLAGGWIEVASNVHPTGEVVISMRPVCVFANGQPVRSSGCELACGASGGRRPGR